MFIDSGYYACNLSNFILKYKETGRFLQLWCLPLLTISFLQLCCLLIVSFLLTTAINVYSKRSVKLQNRTTRSCPTSDKTCAIWKALWSSWTWYFLQLHLYSRTQTQRPITFLTCNISRIVGYFQTSILQGPPSSSLNETAVWIWVRLQEKKAYSNIS